ncbi:hypothetical protein QJS10_CPB04g00346 [Acorus calamus]|uniref:Uncharacterized protein n=1 Tax=Acorus calamus TaxID=4465 RepID=A0AAV9EXU1_ACOCL|nr:hypothetical protein QJS10_CPB04g00346 [Acorus calamus]
MLTKYGKHKAYDTRRKNPLFTGNNYGLYFIDQYREFKYDRREASSCYGRVTSSSQFLRSSSQFLQSTVELNPYQIYGKA